MSNFTILIVKALALYHIDNVFQDFIDVDISDSKLDEACLVLENFLESYWRAVHFSDAILKTNNINKKPVA